MWLVLLTLLDRGVVAIEILDGGVALHPLRLEIPVGHRMAHSHHALAGTLQRFGDGPRHLALAGTGADRTYGDHGHFRLQHRLAWAEQLEVRAGGEHLAGLVHDVGVADV